MKTLTSMCCLLAITSLAGCAAEAEDDGEPLGESGQAIARGATCAPERAAGAVNRYEKALHDTIAYAEGTRGVSRDGYDVTYAFRRLAGCTTHPNKKITAGRYTSTAAGRYQFLGKTWNVVRRANKLTTFEPENQERGAEWLVKMRGARIPKDRPLTAAEFSIVMKKLGPEWASLPTSKYGQPTKKEADVRKQYCAAVGGCT